MSSFEDGIWDHLVREHDAAHAEFPAGKQRSRPTPRKLVALGVGAGSAVTAASLAFTVFGSTPAAYAFVANDNGTVTVSLNEMATGIPALNQLFAQHGIRETVVPIEAGCSATRIEPEAFSGSMDQSVTVGNRWIPDGYNGFLAAEQMPNGQVLLAMGTLPGPVPSCFPATPAPAPVPVTSTSAPTGPSGPSGTSGT